MFRLTAEADGKYMPPTMSLYFRVVHGEDGRRGAIGRRWNSWLMATEYMFFWRVRFEGDALASGRAQKQADGLILMVFPAVIWALGHDTFSAYRDTILSFLASQHIDQAYRVMNLKYHHMTSTGQSSTRFPPPRHWRRKWAPARQRNAFKQCRSTKSCPDISRVCSYAVGRLSSSPLDGQ